MTPNTGTGVFEFTSFLEGQSRAYGLFEDRFGTVRRRFKVELMGAWHDGVFVLNEQFHYCDGGRERRKWRISPKPDGTLIATAADVIGTAKGKTSETGL